MGAVGSFASLVLSTMLCVAELYKVEALLDAEEKRTSSYNTCDRILKLASIEFKLLVLMTIAQFLCLRYTSFLAVCLFVYEARKRGSGPTVSALDFFKQRQSLKIEMFCKLCLYAFLVYSHFRSLVVNKT